MLQSDRFGTVKIGQGFGPTGHFRGIPTECCKALLSRSHRQEAAFNRLAARTHLHRPDRLRLASPVFTSAYYRAYLTPAMPMLTACATDQTNEAKKTQEDMKRPSGTIRTALLIGIAAISSFRQR
jgi:hypothetical protein